VKTLNRALKIITPDEIIPLGDEISQRAALVTERNTAVHAPTGLTCQSSGVARLVDLFPVSNP
jgi:hypothetical protein